MRRLSGLCVLALVLGCGGGSTPKKKDGGGNDAKDAPGTTDVGGTLDHAAEAPVDTPVDGGMPSDAPPDMGPTTGDAALDGGDASDVAPPIPMVTVFFTGEVVTVARANGTGLPLGFDATVRTEKVSGSFSYDPTLLDLTADAKRGKYEGLPGRTSFTFAVKGKTVTGSIHEQMQAENDLPSDTFRFIDGPQVADNTVRTMKLNGVEAPKLKLFIAISDTTGAMLSSDKLPDPFPTIDITKIAHTFSLEDEGGTLLMQLDTLGNKPPTDGGAGDVPPVTDATDASANDASDAAASDAVAESASDGGAPDGDAGPDGDGAVD
jgi:hypothetical protein